MPISERASEKVSGTASENSPEKASAKASAKMSAKPSAKAAGKVSESGSSDKPLTRGEQREADILNAAVQLFSEEGYDAVTTRKIAARAGVSEGTLFNYFGAKHELMRGVLAEIYRELTDNGREILREVLDTRERLQALAENHVRVMSRDNALFQRMIQSYMNRDIAGYTDIRGSVLHEMNLSYAWLFDFTVKEGIARDEIRADVNISALRDLFFGGLEYGSRTLFLHDAFDKLPERVASLLDPLWRSMQPLSANVAAESPARLGDVCDRLESLVERLEQT